jgi:hypothetical protein
MVGNIVGLGFDPTGLLLHPPINTAVTISMHGKSPFFIKQARFSLSTLFLVTHKIINACVHFKMNTHYNHEDVYSGILPAAIP